MVKETRHTTSSSSFSISFNDRISSTSFFLWILLIFLGEGKVGHAMLRCPAFLHWKQSPFSIQHFCSSGVSLEIWITLTSITSGSLGLVEDREENMWYVDFVGW